MKRIGSLTLAALLGVAVWYAGPGLRVTSQQAFAQAVLPVTDGGFDAYKLSYFDVSTAFIKSAGGYGGPGNSGGSGDALLRIVDAGNFEADPVEGSVCANIYVYNDVQEQQECCSCPLTANSLQTFSVMNNLISNPFNAKESLSAGVIKIVGSSGACVTSDVKDAADTTAATLAITDVAEGLHAWINHTESIASNDPRATPPYGFISKASVTAFDFSALDSGELAELTGKCLDIVNGDNASSDNLGICRCGLSSPTLPEKTEKEIEKEN